MMKSAFQVFSSAKLCQSEQQSLPDEIISEFAKEHQWLRIFRAQEPLEKNGDGFYKETRIGDEQHTLQQAALISDRFEGEIVYHQDDTSVYLVSIWSRSQIN